jgi:hypothetical protein
MATSDERTHVGNSDDREGISLEWVIVALFVFCLVLICVATFVGASLLADVNTAVKRIEQVEADNQRVDRATAYRLCSRNAVDRAFAQSFATPDERRALQGPHRLPILDCSPNLEGKGAKPLAPSLQDEFVKRWKSRSLTPEERGICPGSTFGQDGDNC